MEAGIPPEKALYCATYTPSRRMHLYDRGAIAPGRRADFFLVEDPTRLRPVAVYKNGAEIYRRDAAHLRHSVRRPRGTGGPRPVRHPRQSDRAWLPPPQPHHVPGHAGPAREPGAQAHRPGPGGCEAGGAGAFGGALTPPPQTRCNTPLPRPKGRGGGVLLRGRELPALLFWPHGHQQDYMLYLDVS